jgi:hypothetical protein
MVTKLIYWLTNSHRRGPYVSRNNPANFCKIRFNIIFYSYYYDSNSLFLSDIITKSNY